MKRRTLHFLGRKSQSLFDTNIQIKDMDNVELVLDSPVILESGTASVRSRPTVNHHTSSDHFQGFAVPTPKVPLLPPINGTKANGSVGEDRLSNGSVISVPDLVEGEIFVPAPPSVAPPPPPGSFIPPPPDFMGDLNSLEPATLQSPLALSLEEDLAFLKPPPMAPPKPPSTCSSGSGSSVPVPSPPRAKVPQHPKFAPPPPPKEKQHKTNKAPPVKPIRLSSMSNLDLPPQTPAPPPPVQTPTLSTFNPQNTAKLFNVPQPSVLSRFEIHDTRQMLLLEDSGSVKSVPVKSVPVKSVPVKSVPVKSVPVLVQVDGNVSNMETPIKPISRDVPELKENLQITQPSQPSFSESKKDTKTATVSAQPVVTKPIQTLPQKSPQLQKLNSSHVNTEFSKDKLEISPSQSHRFSPLLDRKLRNLKGSETNGAREGPAASPLALLMAAKKREKHRPTHSLSRENSAKKNEQPSTSVYPSDSSHNSFVVVPRSSSSSSPTSQERIEDSIYSIPMKKSGTPEKPGRPAAVRDQLQSTSPAPSKITAAASVSVMDLVGQKHNAKQSPPKTQSAQPGFNKEGFHFPFLPPPPEFDDTEEIMEPPPSIRPPDPPMKKAPTPTVSLPPPAPVLSPSTKPKPPAPPKLPPPDINVKPKSQIQTKPQVVPTQLQSTLSPNQATLLSILQKKMLEMDHKMVPAKEAESSSEDWGAPLSDENNKIPVVGSATPQSKNYPVVNKATALDMRELESKMAKKHQESSSMKVPTSNGPSKHQYGMSFTVRPGTTHPITPVFK